MSDSVRLEDLRRRIEKDPASIAFAQLAEECRRVALYQEAVDVCRRGLLIHPAYLSARVTLGRALLQLGQLEEAQHELGIVLSGAPQNLAAIRAMGEICQRRGLLAEAMTHYRAALTLSPDDPGLERAAGEVSTALSHAQHETEAARARLQVAALEQFRSAIHVTRAQRSA